MRMAAVWFFFSSSAARSVRDFCAGGLVYAIMLSIQSYNNVIEASSSCYNTQCLGLSQF